MSRTNSPSSIRLSQNQIRSNPILASQRTYKLGVSLRDKEQRQFARLMQLQLDGVPLYRLPEMHRVDPSSLILSSDRIGVVGLVVDNHGEGFVTRLHVHPNPTWDISVNLPFRQIHIQNLLLRVLSGPGLDDSLPELFAYKIADSLADRYEGDSMDIACLLAILDASVEKKSPLLNAAAAVVSPIADDLLEPSKSVRAKLEAFTREFGQGSLLVRHADDEDAYEFDDVFDEVWPVRSLSDLADRLADAGLMQAFLKDVTLRSEHCYAIASQLEQWLTDESQFDHAEGFLIRIKRRIDNDTPVKIRLEVSLAEEDLHRHRGNFDYAIAVREQRVKLTESKYVSCYEREVDSDNRHAAALYDAHRLSDAVDCLQSWHERLEQDTKICLPETRAKLVNTLARCLVVMEDTRWESLFQLSLEIQTACDPCNLPVTESFLTHGYLKAQKFKKAKALLKGKMDNPNGYQIWLAAECARQSGETWTDIQCESAIAIDPRFHVHGFACQAIARQEGRQDDSRLKYFEKAERSFSHGMDHDKTNVKRILSLFCSMAIAVVSDDMSSLRGKLAEFRRLTANSAFGSIFDWYKNEIEALDRDQGWSSIEGLFRRVPHL